MTEELTKAAQQALEALEEARDEVEAAKQQAAQLAGYPRTDARHASYVAQLEKHDAAIDALRSALTQRPAAQTEREAFEAEMRFEETWGHRPLTKRPDGRYQNWQVDLMWDVWQARASLPTQPAAQAAQVPDDSALLDHLDTLAKRPAGSDLHCFGGRVVLYVRTGIGAQVEASGAGTAREAIRAAMLPAAQQGGDHG